MKVIEGKITSGFGERIHPVTRVRSFHNGTDVSAPIGTEVRSPIEGKVTDVYVHATGGKTVIIGDENMLRFGFAHLSEPLVKTGDKVSKGQVIARSGNTGLGTGAHLHFSAKTGGTWVGNRYVGGEFVDSAFYIIRN
jgi:murein DD-endopeptidase